MNISVDIVNRKVEGRESIITDAGAFDCYQLSETIKSKSMGVNLEMTSKTWLAEVVGMIKNETFRKNKNSEDRTVDQIQIKNFLKPTIPDASHRIPAGRQVSPPDSYRGHFGLRAKNRPEVSGLYFTPPGPE